jgi:hypothetical protein
MVVIMDRRCRLVWDGGIPILIGDGITDGDTPIMDGDIPIMDGDILIMADIIHAATVMDTMIGIMASIRYIPLPTPIMAPENLFIELMAVIKR